MLQISHILIQVIQYIPIPLLIQSINLLSNLLKNRLTQIILSIKIHHLQIIIPTIIHYILHTIPQFQNPQFSIQPHLQQLTLLFQNIKKYSSQLDEIQQPKQISILLSNAREHPTNLKWKTFRKLLPQAVPKQKELQTRAWVEPHLDQTPIF